MAKKTKSKANKHRNKILGVLIVALVVILFYVFSQQNSGQNSIWGEESYTDQVESTSGEIDEATGLEIVGQSYFGYMKPDYILNAEIDGKTRRIQMKTLNA
ncbi:hypothetical protein HZA99_05975, partial [Candidatus Woesearchaeota archaeon]|nr:hypothetical protein [Candidatus Woesearchaeota archaeon]